MWDLNLAVKLTLAYNVVVHIAGKYKRMMQVHATAE